MEPGSGVSKIAIFCYCGIVILEARFGMNISLTPELEQFVLRKTEGGLYHSASEVIRQALRMFIESEDQKTLEIKRLNREIAVGLEDLSNGKEISGEAAFSKLRVRNLKRQASHAS